MSQCIVIIIVFDTIVAAIIMWVYLIFIEYLLYLEP